MNARVERSPRLAIGLIALWIGAILTGLAALSRYESAPGTAGMIPTEWPKEIALPTEAGRARLLLFAHPHCPCTRSSLAELERLLDRLPVPPQIVVVFVQPAGAAPAWGDTSIWNRAQSIPGVTAVRDEGGRLSRRFGTNTSGHTLLYDETGALQYSGGITAIRGQEGPSRGGAALAARLHGVEFGKSTERVYGCPLHDSVSNLSTKGAACPRP